MFYKTGIDLCNDKQMFNFLKGHFSYDTMNSWNCLKSIANNVKVYNLNLEGSCWVALSALQADDYFCVNSMIEDWEYEHPNYKVGFNGRSGGYLVLYNKDNNCNVLPDYIVDGDYEDYKQYIKDYYGTLKDNRSNLRYLTELVRDFDKLCDDIRSYVNELSKLDLRKEALDSIVEEFNELYHEDLEVLNIEPIDYKVEDYSFNMEQFEGKSTSLRKVLIDIVRDSVERLNLRYDIKHNIIYIQES